MYTVRIGEDVLSVEEYAAVGSVWEQVKETVPSAVLGVLNQEVVGFQMPIRTDGELCFLGLDSKEGNLAYQRTLIMLLAMAVESIFPHGRVQVQHSLGRGLYCTMETGVRVTHQDVEDVEEYMHQLVRENRPIELLTTSRKVAQNICLNEHRPDLAKELETVRTEQVYLYRCGHFYEYFFGPLLPDISFLTIFDLVYYAPGFLLRFPDESNPEVLPEYEELSLFSRVFMEATSWGDLIGCRYVRNLNELIDAGQVQNVVAMSEALHEKMLARMADEICHREPGVRLVTIAGPSSAGKTTTTKRLLVHLRVNGRKPVMVSLDDYYYPPECRPIMADGKQDNESVEALDTTLLELQLMALLAGDPVRLARFDFVEKKRYFDENPTVLGSDEPIVLEGLHALNPCVSRGVPAYQRLHVFVGALTPLTIGDHHRISTTDTRLIRRLVRDYLFRGHTPEDTLAVWNAVRAGEEAYIFPFQERADVFFNTALLYELPVLKSVAEPLLRRVERDSRYYLEAQRLLRFLAVFAPLSTEIVPGHSILREFVGYENPS